MEMADSFYCLSKKPLNVYIFRKTWVEEKKITGIQMRWTCANCNLTCLTKFQYILGQNCAMVAKILITCKFGSNSYAVWLSLNGA